jgi:hypothetical protein
MTTKATRDVINLGSSTDRPIIDGVNIDGDNGPNFTIDGTTIGAGLPGSATFSIATIAAGGTLTFGAGSSMIITDTPLTVVGTLNANYADLAEYYESDEQYEPGTVVSINVDGDSEITASKGDLDNDVLGVVSTNPAYVLNAGSDGLYLPIAQIGRVPCLVHGPVKKGDRIVPCCVGHAQAVSNSVSSRDKMIIGRALESNDAQGVKLVEITINTLK